MTPGYRTMLCPCCGWPVSRETGRCDTLDCSGVPADSHGTPKRPTPVGRGSQGSEKIRKGLIDASKAPPS